MGNAAKPVRGITTGALITDEVAKDLSSRLALLGDQWQEISAELEVAGYGTPAKEDRATIEALAATEEGRSRLHAYWREWAKERLAGLVGPMNILSGKYPPTSAYRSELIAALRADAIAGKLKSEGAFVSPQIEPTLKRYVESSAYTLKQKRNDDIKKARQQAASALCLPEDTGFGKLNEGERYEILLRRYRAVFEPAGFTLDSHRKTGLVFRKPTSDARWTFLVVDESRDGVDTGMLSPSFALTLPKKAVLPEVLSLCSVATFSPDDLVPRFRASCIFERDSYAQFCLAADSIAFLVMVVYRRLDALLVTGNAQS